MPEELKFTELKKIHNTVSLSFKCGAKYNTNDVEEFCSSKGKILNHSKVVLVKNETKIKKVLTKIY